MAETLSENITAFEHFNYGCLRQEMASVPRDYILAWRDHAAALEQRVEALEPKRRCGTCNSPRHGDVCWKCGAETFEPADGWTEPRMICIGPIREAAREVGYAIGEHGSREKDVDLIAAPWTEDAVSPDALIAHLCEKCLLAEHGRSEKPFGRVGVTLLANGWYKHIDLSICPQAPDAAATKGR